MLIVLTSIYLIILIHFAWMGTEIAINTIIKEDIKKEDWQNFFFKTERKK